MALMSLTGWAQTATIGDVAIGDYTYGGWALPDDAVVKDSEGAILTKGTHYEISVGAYSDEACTTGVELAAMKADGTTKYYRQITGKGAYVGQKKAVWFKVAKADATIHLTVALGKNYGAENPAVGDYTIKYQKAISADETEATDITNQFEGTLAYTYEGTNAGEHALTFSGITPKADGIGANFNLVTTDVITINPLNISATATITAWQADVEYTGDPIIGVYTVKDKEEGGIVLTAGTAPVLYANAAEYNAAKGTALDNDAFEALDEAQKIKTPATGDYYVDAVTNVKWTAGEVAENCPTIHFQGNYTGTKAVAEGKGFKVTPAPLTVTVEDFKVDYDNNNHARLIAPIEGELPAVATEGVKFVYSGFLGADIQPLTKAALIDAFTAPTKVIYDGEAINAGEYALTISGGSAGERNYEFKNYLPGKLIINKKKVQLTSKSVTKKLGEADPKFELNAAPALIGTDYIKDGTLTFDRQDADKADKVGKFTITPNTSAIVVLRPAAAPGAAPTDVTANYNVVAAAEGQGQLTITAAGIVISIKDASKKYGEADPTKFDYVITGLQDGDELAAVTVTRDKAGTTAGEAAGAYLMNAEAPANPNADKYASVTVVPAIFTIAKAELEITMPTQNVAKDTGLETDLKKDGITATGINNTDKIADLIQAPAFAAGVGVGANATIAEGYSVTLTDAAQTNYKIVKVNGVAIGAPTLNTATTAYGKLIVGAGTAEAINFTSTDGDAEADPVVPSDYSLIKGHAGETQNVRLTIAPRFNREVPAGKKHGWAAQTWNTMVLPFEVSVADLSVQLGYAIVNVVDPSKTTEDNVQFKLEMDKIPANTPFCVKTSQALTTKEEGGEDKPYFLDFEGVKIVDAGEYVSVDAGMGYKFVGAYKTKKIDKTTPTYNFLRGDNAKWAHIGGTSANSWTVVPFDAYVELTEAAAARGVTFTFQELDGSFTAIKAIAADVNDEGAAKTGWYNLNGMKLQSAPAQKGVYIHNGKKVIVK